MPRRRTIRAPHSCTALTACSSPADQRFPKGAAPNVHHITSRQAHGLLRRLGDGPADLLGRGASRAGHVTDPQGMSLT